MIDRLSKRPELVCAIDYLFVEFHHLPRQRANLTRWGLDEDLYEIVKNRIHAAMELPGCRTRVYWRSFWAACGDAQRFEWVGTPQVTDKPAAPKKTLAPRRRPRRQMRAKGQGSRRRKLRTDLD